MKKIVLILIAVFTTSFAIGQTATKINGAEIKFESMTCDFGTLKIGDVKVGYYTFTNIGNKPLILDDVKTSCDCTTIEYPKAPVMPGKTEKIKVTYTAEDPGQINKWITVFSNAESYRVVLKTKGKVLSN
ncbi:MAG TPA: DUF1573 domain-containing protein [Bacteroidales bacterium]|nr:DUF1573 domain-containing protein [Bacteroidales bacterium]